MNSRVISRNAVVEMYKYIYIIGIYNEKHIIIHAVAAFLFSRGALIKKCSPIIE